MFDAIAQQATFIIVALVVMWIVQFGMAYLQMRRFYKRLVQLRKGGLTAVGLGGGQYRGRAYAVLTIDDNDTVVHAEQFAGWTVFARLRPVPDMLGMTLQDVIDNEETLPVSKKVRAAFGKAAQDLLSAREEEAETTAPALSPA